MSNDPFAKWRVQSPTPKENDPFAKWRTGDSGNTSGRGLGTSALRQVGRLGRSALTGIAGIGDLLTMPLNLGASALHAAGLKETPTLFEPIAGKVQQGIDTLSGGILKPENKTEEYVDMISEGLAPLALTGGTSLAARAPGMIGKGARGLAQAGNKVGFSPTASNIAGSAGSSAALKTYLDEGGDPNIVGALLAGTAGGAAGRSALKLANPLNAAAGATGWATRFSPEKYAQQKELGLPVSLGNVSKGKVPGYLEMIAAKTPPSMGPLEKFYKRREKAIGSNLGVSTPEDLQQAVENVPKHLAKQGAEKYHQRASDIYKKREEKFKPRENAAIANQELIDVSDIIEKLEHERSLSLTPGAQKRFDKSKEGILLKELKESIPESAESIESSSIAKSLRSQGYPENIINKLVSEVPESKKGIGLHDLNKLREKALQESMELKTPIGGGTPESKRAAERSEMLAGKRHQFMEETGSPTEIHNARQARNFWSQYKNEKDGMAKYVSKITGADNDAAAFKKLLNGDQPKYLRIVRQGLDKNAQEELGQGIVNELGKRQGRWNINTFHTNFLKKDKGWQQEVLKTIHPSKAAKENFLRTMDFVGDNKRMMEKLANTSNTAHSKEVIDMVKRYGAAAAAAATGYGIGGLLGVGIEQAALWGGAKVWTSQKFLKRVNDVMTAKTVTGKTHKLDVLYKSLNQLGRQSHHLEENE